MSNNRIVLSMATTMRILTGFFACFIFTSVNALEINADSSVNDSLNKSISSGETVVYSIEAERARQKRIASTEANAGGALSCSKVSKNYALWSYCDSGSCSGFARDHELWRLCEHNDADAMSRNYAIWRYLKEGDASGLAKNYKAWKRAQNEAGSFASRKRFVIYYLNGYTYE